MFHQFRNADLEAQIKSARVALRSEISAQCVRKKTTVVPVVSDGELTQNGARKCTGTHTTSEPCCCEDSQVKNSNPTQK